MGLSYQTLVSSVLHQYISGRLAPLDDNKTAKRNIPRGEFA